MYIYPYLEEADMSAGLRFSAGLLVLIGGFMSLATILFFLVLLSAIYPKHRVAEEASEAIRFAIALPLSAGSAWTCFRAASGFHQGVRWACIAGSAVGLLVLTYGVWILYDAYSPPRPGSFHGDDGFGVLLSPFLILIGLWLCVYLNLPHVRRNLRSPTA